MSKEKVYANARLLSKDEKSEVVVYQNSDESYGYSLLDEYEGNPLHILVTFSDGYILE